ncbi:CDP-alcohol phosphatidyltransferase family protein [Blattabacterium cuenoti]|uniref:CDP-alcohol phosphatidyltransferase family protein n=1 Tax=Blattabacterium cuenoti TaxID=1653831 RepID=UPI001EEC97EA|nr:CDP-alcohol phosphatidyltransferase family protein [Blattabacterium cuenoti]
MFLNITVKKIRNVIPNTFTTLNLFFGCVSLTLLQLKEFDNSAIFTLFSFLFDFLDGFTSRIIKNKSKIGKELDSLADIISFGLVPSMIVFSLLKDERKKALPFIEWFSFLIIISSAFRLAEFNITSSFRKKNYGLTTPINTLFFTTLSFIMRHQNTGYIKTVILNPMIIVSLIFFSCYFLLSKIPMFSLIFSDFSWKKNKKRYLFLLISIFLFLTLHLVAIPCIIILYIITSIYYNQRKNFQT